MKRSEIARNLLATAWACAAMLTVAHAAPRAETVSRGGTTVEFIGLEEWTPERIDAALTKGKPIEPYYCAANLKQDVGMSDASVMHHMPGKDGKRTIIVTVVEPQYADRVVYKPQPEGSDAPIDRWEALRKNLAGRTQDVQIALIKYGEAVREGNDNAYQAIVKKYGREMPGILEVWQLLSERRTQADQDRAIWALAHHADAETRAVAGAILAGFPEHDLAVWALVDGLRDADSSVRSACGQALITWTKNHARPIDWEPVLPTLRHLLGGTNLFAFPWVLDMLATTGIESNLVPDLLRDRHDLVLDTVAASHERTRDRALTFLRKVSGQELGPDRDAWQAWIDSLHRDRP